MPCPPPSDLPTQGSNPRSPARLFTAEPPGKPASYPVPGIKISTRMGEGFGGEWIHVYVMPESLHCSLEIVDQLYKIKSLMFGKKKSILGLPGGWVVRTLSFHFKGYGFNPGSGN